MPINDRITRKRTNFSQISNTIILDENITDKAFRIYSTIQACIDLDGKVMPDGGVFHLTKQGLIKKMANLMPEKTFNTHWSILQKSGYLKTRQQSIGKNKFNTMHEILDEPDTSTPYFILYTKAGEVAKTNDCNQRTPQKGTPVEKEIQRTPHSRTPVEVGGHINTLSNNTLSSVVVVVNYTKPLAEYLGKEPSTNMINQLKDYDESMILLAIKQADEQGGKTFKYMLEILMAWKDKGIVTEEQVIQDNAKHKNNQKVKTKPKTRNSKTKKNTFSDGMYSHDWDLNKLEQDADAYMIQSLALANTEELKGYDDKNNTVEQSLEDLGPTVDLNAVLSDLDDMFK